MWKTTLLLVGLILLVLVSSGCVGEKTTTVSTPQPQKTVTQQTPTPTKPYAPPTTTIPPQKVGSYNKILLVGFETGTYGTQYSAFVDTLRGKGYAVHTLSRDAKISKELLAEYGIIVIGGRYYALREKEPPLIVEWINAGGSALVIPVRDVSHTTEISNLNAILLPISGIKINADEVVDNRNTRTTESYTDYIITDNIIKHPITDRISKLGIATTKDSEGRISGPHSVGITDERAKIIVRGKEDAYSKYYTNSPPFVVVYENKGRVVVISANYNASPFDNSHIGLLDNHVFAINIVKWLSHQ